MINILSLGLDKKIFEPDSASLERLKIYSNFCEKMVVIVLTLQKFEPIKFGNLEVYATGSSSRWRYFFDARRLIDEIVKKENINVFMSQDPFETGLIGWLTKKRYGLPWQCQIHGDIFSSYFRQESFLNKLRILLAKFLLPRADGIRAVSERIKLSLISNFKSQISNILVLPIFVDVEKLKSAETKTDLRQKYPQFDFIGLVASRLSREKNIALAIAVMKEIVEKYPKAGLIIVGEGREKKNLELLVKKYRLNKNIIFEPWSDDLASYYKTVDVFLLTSNYEGWGMTVVEAAACACPIVMTDVGCAGEFIKNGENGLVVGVDNKRELVVAIEKIISNQNFGQNLGLRAQAAALVMHKQSEYLKLYEQSFCSIIEKSKLKSMYD